MSIDIDVELKKLDIEYQIGIVKNNLLGLKKDMLRLEKNRQDIFAKQKTNEDKLAELQLELEEV